MDKTSTHKGSGFAARAFPGGGRLVEAVLSLQCKATVLVVALTLTVTAMVSGYFLRSSIALSRRQHDEQLVQLAAMLTGSAADKLARGATDALQALAEDAANGYPLVYVVFSDVEGRELAAAYQPGHGHCLEQHRQSVAEKPVPGTPVYQGGAQDQPGCLAVTYPVNVPGTADSALPHHDVELVGYVHTGTIANGWQQWMSSKLDLVIGVGILAIAVAIPLGFLLVRRIVSPLEGLAVAMQRFSRGKLDVRSPVGRRDEIGRLARTFNQMADQHQQTHERIVRLNASLEERVAQRTQQLRELAARDPLTGLYNRRHFNEVLERSFSETLRYDNTLSCIMIDLDDFKAVNDAFGHHIGDELLVLTASTISGQLRASDIPARFGGDEFIVLLPQTGVDRARVLAERIAEKFAGDVLVHLPRVRTGLSMGIASAPAPGVTNATSLIRAADRALYDAKALGKNCLVTAAADPMQTSG